MHKIKKSTIIGIIIALLIGIIAPLILGTKNNYYMNILISFCYFGIIAASLNLLMGYSGQISLGHSAFMAIGAYAYAILNKTFHFHFILAAIGAIAISFLCGLLIGLACGKLNAIFLAMATLGFSKAVTLILTNEGWLTGGANGFTGIPKLVFFGHKLSNFELYYVALALMLVVFLICYRIVYSKTGRAFQALKTSPIAAAAMGVDVKRYRLLVCGISAAMAGLAGCIYAVNLNYLSADMFNKTSIRILTMSVAGGLGNLSGPIVGAVVMGGLPELLRTFSSHLDGVYGALLIFIVIVMPDGFVGGLNSLKFYIKQKIKSKKQTISLQSKKAGTNGEGD
jgi:branched-chain amino acid transport system permease protein